MAKSKVPTAPKNAKEGIAQSKALINKYAVTSKAKTVKTSTKPKTDSKKAIPASDPRYKNMTPAQRNANTLKNVKESLAGPKKATGIKTAAANAAKKAPVKKATNTPTVKATPKKETSISIEQKAKDVMSGKYGTGTARKKALGADYDKVQAIVNKQMASSKPKTAPTKEATKTVAAPEKMEIKKPGSIAYTGPKELVGVKPTSDNVDKYIDAAMKGIKKSKIMKKGGMVKPLKKAQDGMVAGPFTEKTAKTLDNSYPSTSAKIPLDPFYQTNSYKMTGANKPYSVDEEALGRIDREEFLRSPKIFKKKGGPIKTTYKTGGSTKSKTVNSKPTGMDALKGLGKYVTTLGGALGDFGPKSGVQEGVKKGIRSKMKTGGTKTKKK